MASRATQSKGPQPARAKARAAKIIVRHAGTGEFKLALKPTAIKGLQTRKAGVKVVMEVLGEGIETSRKTGRGRSFVILVDGQGRPSIKFETTSATKQQNEDDDLEAALAAARDRGRRRAAEILAGDEMLSADDFAELLGVSKPTVHARREKHELLALDGPKRGFRFPAWQVDQNGKPFAAIPLLFGRLGDSAWTVYRFLTQPHAALDGVTGIEALRHGDDEAVIETAEGIARGTFA